MEKDELTFDGNQDYSKNDMYVALVTRILNPTNSTKAKEMKLLELEKELEVLFTNMYKKKTSFRDVYGRPLLLFIQRNIETFDLLKKKGDDVVKLKISKMKSGKKFTKMTGPESDQHAGDDQITQTEKTDADHLEASVHPEVPDDINTGRVDDGHEEGEWKTVRKGGKKKGITKKEEDSKVSVSAGVDNVQNSNIQVAQHKAFVEKFLRQEEGSHLIFYPDDKIYKHNPHQFVQDIVSLWNTPCSDNSFIVLGVKCRTHLPHKVIGLQFSNHNDYYQTLFESEYFTNKPEYEYTQYTYDEYLIGVITVFSSLGRGSPSVVKADSPEFKISKGQLWARYNKQNNVVPQEDLLTGQIYQWFQSKEKDISVSSTVELVEIDTKTTQQTPSTIETCENEFAAAVDHFKKGYFVLISGESIKVSKKLEKLALVPWLSVYDFDKYTRDRGLLSCLEDVIKKKRCLNVCTWKNPPANLTESGTQWCCMRGLREIPDSQTKDDLGQWFEETKSGLDSLCISLARFAEDYTVLNLIILWPDEDISAQCVYRFLCHLDFYLGPSKLIIICFENPRTDVSNSSLMLLMNGRKEDAVKITLCQDELCNQVENMLEINPVNKHIKYTLPTEEGHVNHYIDDADAAWLREDLDVLYESNPYTPNPSDVKVLEKEAENFFHGGTIQWFAWYELGPGYLEVQRDIMNKIIDHIKGLEKAYRSVIITLFHAPGGGGTTIAQRILWEFHRSIPCVEVKNRASVEGLADKITFLHDKTHLPVVVLVDGDDESRVKQLVKSLKSVSAIFLYVKRYPYPISDRACRPRENLFYLKGVVSAGEASKLALRFADRCDNALKKRKLNKMSREVQQNAVLHYVFEFGMTVYDSEFKGVASYVRGYLCLNNNPQCSLLPWHKILAYLSLVYYYGQSSVPCQFFGNLLQLPPNYDVDINDFLFPLNLFVVQGSKNGRSKDIRICHYLVAKEILEHILCPLNKYREEGLSRAAKRGLKDLCVEFITYASKKTPKSCLTAVTIMRILTQTFIFRDNKDVGENETQNKKKHLFSQIMNDADPKQPYSGRLEILEKLTRSFPKDPNFQAHLGRFYAYCRPDEGDKAEACFKRALELCEPQIHGKVITDIDDGMRLTLMHIYHMYGMIFKGRISRYTGRKPMDRPERRTSAEQFLSRAERITSDAEKACIHFSYSREYKPPGHDEIPDYAFSSEIRVRLHVCDFIQRNYKKNGMTGFLSDFHDHSAAKFIRNTVCAIENLIVEFYSVVDPENIDNEYREAVSWYCYLFKNHTTRLTKMFPVVDLFSRRLTIAAMKLKYLECEEGTCSVFEKSMSKDDVRKLVQLYEGNFTDALTFGESNKGQLDGDYKEWLYAIRNPSFGDCYSIEKVLMQVRNWHETVSSPSSMFYLFICTSLVGFGTRFLNGNSETLVEAQILKKELQKKSKLVWRPRYPREWLGKDEKGIKCLITHNRIGHIEDRHVKRSSSSLLAVCKGTIRSPNKKPLSGYIDLDLGDNSIPVEVFFIPVTADLNSSRYAGERVQFHLAFTLDHGYEAFEVSLLKKYPCSFCGNKYEIPMNMDRISCSCGESVVRNEMDASADEIS